MTRKQINGIVKRTFFSLLLSAVPTIIIIVITDFSLGRWYDLITISFGVFFVLIGELIHMRKKQKEQIINYNREKNKEG